MTPTEILPASQTKEIRSQVDCLADDISAQRKKLADSYVRVGALLQQVQDLRHYESWGFSGFKPYLQSLEDRLGVKFGQLYHMIATVKNLPELTEPELLEMGLTKAGFLKDYKRKTKQLLPPDLLETAKNPDTTVEKLKAEVHQRVHGAPPEGFVYRSIHVCCTQDDWAEVQRAMKLAEKVGEIDPAMSDLVRQGAAIRTMSQEFIGTYGGDL